MFKKEYDKSLTRLVGILTAISNSDFKNTKEFAQEFGVTDRTIQTDIYKRLYQFPITKNSDGKFCFIDGYTLNKTTLNSDEMMLLSLALSQFNEVSDFDKIQNKLLKKLLYTKFINPYYIKQDDIEDLEIDSTIIKTLEEAIEYSNIIILHLTNKTTMIEPYKIANFDGFWYLFGKDLDDDRVKTFKISHIKKIEITSRKHKTSHTYIETLLDKIHSAYFVDGNSYEIVIKVHKEVSDYFRKKEFIESQKIIQENSDGSLHVSFEVTHDEDVDNIIKSWLPHVEVLEPKRFREKIFNELNEYVKMLQIR